MADPGAIRLLRELQQLETSENIGITVHYKDDNIRNIQALLIGPPGTPYALGFYRFRITIPTEYPAAPPEVRILTTNDGLTRFGPNLYADGLVCLSIIGTWPGLPGEEWSPAQGLESVLLSVQSLLSAEPYKNEPGFDSEDDEDDDEDDDDDDEEGEDDDEDETEAEAEPEPANAWRGPESAKYNLKITHENLRLAVIKPLEEAFNVQKNRFWGSNDGETSQEVFGAHVFDDHYKQRLLWYSAVYKQAIEDGVNTNNQGLEFDEMPFESRINGMYGRYDYRDLQKRIVNLQDALMAETYQWPRRGLVFSESGAPLPVNLREQQKEISGELTTCDTVVDLRLADDNPFLWLFTYVGRSGGQCEDGVLNIKIYISPNHPVEQPRVFLETPLFHVRVSPGNALMYQTQPARAEQMTRHIHGIIAALEETMPPYSPLMIVNPEASKLCWGSSDERKLYHRKLRRSITKSVECV